MMDTSETYIKMCEKAEEIQKLHQWRWDDLWFDKFNMLIKHYNPLIGLNRENLATDLPDRYSWQQTDNMVWLPRQDQLQEMVDFRPNVPTDIVYALSGFLKDGGYDFEYALGFTSMEQLWLAFVMKEKYNKVWNGEDWLD